MGIFLQEKRLRVAEIIGENTVQAIAEGTLDLPAGKPDIDRVLYARLQPEITDLQPAEDKVVVQGVLTATVVYVPVAEEGRELPAVSVSYREVTPFETEVPLSGVIPGADLRPKIKVLKVTTGAGGKRRFEIDTVLSVTVRALKTVPYNVVSEANVSGGQRVQVRRETVNILDLVGLTMCQIPVKAELGLTEGLPVMEEILDLWAAPAIASMKVVEGKILLEGNVDLSLIYLSAPEGENAHTTVNSARYDKGVRFSAEAPLAEAQTGMQNRGTVFLKRADAFMVDEGTVGINLLLEAWVEVYRQSEVEAVTELKAEGIDEIEVNRQMFKAEVQVGEKTVVISAEGHLQVPSHRPPVSRVVAAESWFQPTETRVLDGKVMVDGILGVKVLYLAAGDEEGTSMLHVAEFPEALRLTEFVDIPRAQGGMATEYDVQIRKVQVQVIDADTLQVEINGDLSARVTSQTSLEVVSEAVVVPPALDDDPTSLRVVVIQPGDTLWKLAHRYRTSVEAIASSNGLAPNISLVPGQKLRVKG